MSLCVSLVDRDFCTTSHHDEATTGDLTPVSSYESIASAASSYFSVATNDDCGTSSGRAELSPTHVIGYEAVPSTEDPGFFELKPVYGVHHVKKETECTIKATTKLVGAFEEEELVAAGLKRRNAVERGSSLVPTRRDSKVLVAA